MNIVLLSRWGEATSDVASCVPSVAHVAWGRAGTSLGGRDPSYTAPCLQPSLLYLLFVKQKGGSYVTFYPFL